MCHLGVNLPLICLADVADFCGLFCVFAPLRFRSRDGYWLQGPMCQGQERLEAIEDFDSRMVSMNDDPYMTVRYDVISESFESIRMVK